MVGPTGQDDAITCAGSTDPNSSLCQETYDGAQAMSLKVELEPGWTLVGWKVNGVWDDAPALLLMNDASSAGSSSPRQHSGNVTVEAVAVKFVQHADLWWFNGENAQYYDEDVLLEAKGAPSSGNFHWKVTSGVDKVNFENDADEIITDGRWVTIKSTAASVQPDDVTILLSIDGEEVATHTLSVYAPGSSEIIEGPIDGEVQDETGKVIGFTTEYWLQIKNQLGGDVIKPIEANETFEGFTPVYPETNWFAPENLPGELREEGQIRDRYGAIDLGGMIPKPVSPNDQEANVPVFYATQHYWVGSTLPGHGIKVKTHQIWYYRGKARQQ